MLSYGAVLGWLVVVSGARGVALLAFVLAATVLGVSRAQANSIGVVPDGGCIAYTNPDGQSALFCDADIQSTGTGSFDPFLRTFTSREGSSGWNTGSGRGSWEGGNDAGDSWTSALALASIGSVVLEGSEYGLSDGTYRTFALDVNGSASDPYVTLTQFELYDCGTADYASLGSCSSFLDLFADGTSITFDARNHSGSGSGDIVVYVLDSGFDGPYIALQDGWNASYRGGFQEWAALPCLPGAPCAAGAEGQPGGGATGGPPMPLDSRLPQGPSLQSPESGGGTGGEGAREVPEPGAVLMLASVVAVALRRRIRQRA